MVKVSKETVARLKQNLGMEEANPKGGVPAPPFTMQRKGGLFTFQWGSGQLEGLRIRIDRLYEDSHKTLTGEILVEWPGVTGHIQQARYNLLATTTKASLAKHCNEIISLPEWNSIIETVSLTTLREYRQGEPAVELCDVPPIKGIPYRLFPFLVDKAPNLIFGEGGIGKSTIAAWFAVMVQEGVCHQEIAPEPGQVLYLDYEEDAEVQGWRFRNLYRGLDMDASPHILHRRCWRPVADEIEEIQRIILDRNVQLVIIDSAVYACGNEPESAEATSAYFTALRTLDITSATIAHKTNQGGDRPFGSVQWRNSPRNIYEVKKAQEPEEDALHIILKHAKASNGKLRRPWVCKVEFDNENEITTVEEEDIRDVPEFSSDMTALQQIMECVRRGAKTVAEIAEETGLTNNTVKVTCFRHKGKALAQVGTNLGNIQWGLASL